MLAFFIEFKLTNFFDWLDKPVEWLNKTIMQIAIVQEMVGILIIYLIIKFFIWLIFDSDLWYRNGPEKKRSSSVVLIEDIERTIPPKSTEETSPVNKEPPVGDSIPIPEETRPPLPENIPSAKNPSLPKHSSKRRSKLHWKSFLKWTILVIISLFLGYYGVFFLDTIWPHRRYSPEVDAAIISSIVTSLASSLTIFVTVGYTVKSNREMQEAMKEQSRSSLRDKLWENRQKIYPQLRVLNKEIRNKLVNEPERHPQMKKALESIEEFQLNNEHHLSEDLLILLRQMMNLCQLQEEDPINDQLHKRFLAINEQVDAQILVELRLNLPDRDLKAMMKSDLPNT